MRTIRLYSVLVGLLTFATGLSAGVLPPDPFNPPELFPDNTWVYFSVCDPDTGNDGCPSVAIFQLVLPATDPITDPVTTRQVRLVDGFTSGDMYSVTVDDNPSFLTDSVPNTLGSELDQWSLVGLGNDVQAFAADAWSRRFPAPDTDAAFSSAQFNLDTGATYSISIFRTQHAVDGIFGNPFDNAGVFIFVDPPIDSAPEPGTCAMLGLGLCAVAVAVRRRSR